MTPTGFRKVRDITKAYQGSEIIDTTKSGQGIIVSDPNILAQQEGVKENNLGKGNGRISVFTEYKYGTTDVYVDDVFIGQLNSFFPAGTPEPACGQEGTVSKILVAGSHQVRAKNSDGTYWMATTYVGDGECYSQRLQKNSDAEFKGIAGIKYNEFGKGNGKLSVFTEYERGTTDVYVDDIFIGQLNSYFLAGTSRPVCGQEGTVNKILEAGSHQVRAKNSDGTYWETTTYVGDGECHRQVLQ